MQCTFRWLVFAAVINSFPAREEDGEKANGVGERRVYQQGKTQGLISETCQSLFAIYHNYCGRAR